MLVDFVYVVYIDIGYVCVGVCVDCQFYLLLQLFFSGQIVEIIIVLGVCLNVVWLNFVVSLKVCVKICQLLKNFKCDDLVSFGCCLFNYVLGGSCKFVEILLENIQCEFDCMKLVLFDDLLVEIGLGNVMSVVVVKNLQQGEVVVVLVLVNVLNYGYLLIKGVDGVLIIFVKCCCLISGDLIIVYVSLGKGLVIYYEFCCNICGYQKELEKFMVVEWDKEIVQEFIIEIKVDMFNYQGVLVNLMVVINIVFFNIQSLNMEEKDGCVYSVFICLIVCDCVYLVNIMCKICIMLDVIKVICN